MANEKLTIRVCLRIHQLYSFFLLLQLLLLHLGRVYVHVQLRGLVAEYSGYLAPVGLLLLVRVLLCEFHQLFQLLRLEPLLFQLEISLLHALNARELVRDHHSFPIYIHMLFLVALYHLEQAKIVAFREVALWPKLEIPLLALAGRLMKLDRNFLPIWYETVLLEGFDVRDQGLVKFPGKLWLALFVHVI